MQDQVAQMEATVTQVTDERDKAQTALKRLTDEVKAKEEQWASESQVSIHPASSPSSPSLLHYFSFRLCFLVISGKLNHIPLSCSHFLY